MTGSSEGLLALFAAERSIPEARARWRFHGTCEDFDGRILKPGGYDGVFWTAAEPGIAQSYIPASGMGLLAGFSKHQMNERLRPSLTHDGRPEGLYAIALQLGFPASPSIERDAHGRLKSWAIPDGFPTYRDLAERLCALGYALDAYGDFAHTLKLDSGALQPADWRKPGRLFLIRVPDDLRLYDISRGESDLTDKQWHAHPEFQWAKTQGFDGIVIDDFAQVDGHGNVGHRSYGLFPKALKRLVWADIPATHYTPERGGSWDTTPEIEALIAKFEMAPAGP